MEKALEPTDGTWKVLIPNRYAKNYRAGETHKVKLLNLFL
jgi:hypothetical protein